MCIVGMNGLRSQSFPTIRGSVKNNEKWNNSNGVRWSDLFCKNKSTLKCTFHYLQLLCCCIGFAEVETLDIVFCSVYTFLQILDASLIIIFHFLPPLFCLHFSDYDKDAEAPAGGAVGVCPHWAQLHQQAHYHKRRMFSFSTCWHCVI